MRLPLSKGREWSKTRTNSYGSVSPYYSGRSYLTARSRCCAPESKKPRWQQRWSIRRGGRARRRCLFRRSLLRERDPPCRTDALPRGRSHPAGSSYATSVLYSQVIVPTRLALYGSVPRRIRHATLTRQCGQRSRRQLMPCALASPSVTSTAPHVKCCTRLV